jgi:hypothetical protein
MMSARKIVWLAVAIGFLVLGGIRASAHDVASTDRQISSWSQEKWPFPIDQWGTGRAFRCSADRCGREIHLYVRAKVGFCRCATGVSDDDEIERVGDLELIGLDYQGLASGRPVNAGIMSGRARLFSVARPLQSALPVLTIALAHKCDAIVATVTAAELQSQSDVEAQALDFLRSATFQHWVESQGGSE